MNAKTIRMSVLIALLCATAGVSLGMQLFGLQECRIPNVVRAQQLPAQPQSHVTLTPSSSGDDTAQIEQAFETVKAAGPNGIVELREGTFTISRPVVVEDFDGTFKGAGRGLTVVENKIIPGGFPAAPEPLPAFPSLFAFVSTTRVARGGSADNPANLAFSDMTIKEHGVGEGYAYHEGNPMANDFMAFVLVTGRNVAGTNDGLPGFVNVDWRRMGLVGELSESLPPMNKNGTYGIDIWGWGKKERARGADGIGWIVTPDIMDSTPLTGTFTVADSTFDKLECPFTVVSADNSDITFKDSVASDVFWNGAHFWAVKSTLRPSNIDVSNVKIVNPASTIAYMSAGDAIAFWKIDGANVNVTGLDTTNVSGIFVQQWTKAFFTAANPTNFVFTNNTIRMMPDSWYGGFELYDAVYANFGIKTANFVISGNDITDNNSYASPYDALYTYGLTDTIVSDNKFHGKGGAAVWIEPDGTKGGECTMVNNDYQDFASGFGFFAYLGEGAKKCTVFTGSATDVVDNGIANKVLVDGKVALGIRKHVLGLDKDAAKEEKLKQKQIKGMGKFGFDPSELSQ